MLLSRSLLGSSTQGFAPTSYWPRHSPLAARNERRWEFATQNASFHRVVKRSGGIFLSQKGNRVFQGSTGESAGIPLAAAAWDAVQVISARAQVFLDIGSHPQE